MDNQLIPFSVVQGAADNEDITLSSVPAHCQLNACDTGFGKLVIVMCEECFVVVETHTAGAGRVELHGTRDSLISAQMLLMSRLIRSFAEAAL